MWYLIVSFPDLCNLTYSKECLGFYSIMVFCLLQAWDISDFIWDFRKLPFPSNLGKYFIEIGKISAKIHEIGKIKAIFGLGMTPI